LLSSGLKLGQRLCYTSGMMYFMFGLPRLVFLLAPLAFLVFGRHIFNATPLMVLAYAMPHLAHAIITNSKIQGRFRHSFWAEVYETALAPYILLPTWLALINPGLGTFNVTAKGGLVEKEHFDKTIARPYLFLLVLIGAGMVAGAVRLGLSLSDWDVLAINLGWSMYNFVVGAATVAVAFERRQVRESWRIDARIPALLRLPGGHAAMCTTRDISAGGASAVLEEPIDIEADVPLTLTLLMGDQALPLPIRVVSAKGKLLRARFDEFTGQGEEWSARALFSRADAWIDWRDEGRDKPTRAAWSLAGHAMNALHKLALGRSKR